MNRDISLRFNQYLLENKIWYTRQRLDYFLSLHFRGFNLTGSNILEIGAGPGYFTVWCVVNGARNVVALEPEADGSTLGIRNEFVKIDNALNLKERISYMPLTFDRFYETNKERKFDYILMHAVINHINENACQKLHLKKADKERSEYIEVFKRIKSLLKSGGVLSIYDVGRYNLFSALHIKNPFAPTIEFQKHQQPRTWKKLCMLAGFKFLDNIWVPSFRMRRFGFLLRWWIPCYVTYPGFIIRFKKAFS